MKSDSINIPKYIRSEKVLFQILLAFILLFLNKGNAQTDYKFEHIGYESGIPDIFTPTGFVQDHLGFLWFAGSNSIIKYDGYNARVYQHYNYDSLSGVYHTPNRSLFLDRENRIWIATNKSVKMYQYDKDSFVNFNIFPQSSRPLSYYSVQQDRSGLLWIAHFDLGLFSFNISTKEVQSYRHDNANPNSISTDALISLVIDYNNNLWISTYDRGLDKFEIDRKIFTHYAHYADDTTTVGSNITRALYRGRNGNIWIALDSNRFDELDPAKGKFKHYRIENEYRISKPFSKDGNQEITSFFEDKSGLMWLGLYPPMKGVIVLDENKKKQYQFKNDPLIPHNIANTVTTINEDSSGLIWLGTASDGLYKHIKQKQIFKYYINDKNPARVLSIKGDSLYNIWIGTGNGLDKLQLSTGKYTHYESEKGNAKSLSDNEVTSLLIDKTGIVWAGTRAGGLNKFDIKRNEFTQYKHNPKDSNSISRNTIADIFETSAGDLWIATISGGLDKFDRKNNVFTNFINNDDTCCKGVSTWPSNVIYEDRDGTFWVGSGTRGLSKFNYYEGTYINVEDVQSVRHITGICEDTKDRFWLTSTRTGLTLFDRNTATTAKSYKNFNIPGNQANNILADNSGKIWIGTRHGITCFDPESDLFSNYDKGDDLEVTDFSQKAAYKSRDGTMYFGGEGGIISFHPDSLIKNTHVPNIVLTDFKLNSQSVIPSDSSLLKKNINVAEEVDLSYWDKSFSFEFAALDYVNPAKNQFAYMMEGFDKDWINSGNVRTASYTNLDPGEYTFRVKGSNSDGVWNEKGTSIRVIITPPWWQRWWFRGCGIILILGILGYSRQRKISKIRKEIHQKEEFTRQLIESQEQERKRIAGELHDSLGQNLLMIKNKAILSLKENDLSEILRGNFNEISDLTSATLTDVRTISYNLRPHELDRIGLTKTIEALIERAEKSTAMKFKSELNEIDSIFPSQSEITIFRIIQECINNIIKHSGADEVHIVIQKDSSDVQFSIIDNGKGFDMASAGTRGGFGLKGIKERVNLLNGNLTIDSAPGKGTIVKIILTYNDTD